MIIDSPPVGPVIDAKVAMALADKVVFVVRWQLIPREMVAQSIDGLGGGRKLAGIALGAVDGQGAALRTLLILFQPPLQKL